MFFNTLLVADTRSVQYFLAENWTHRAMLMTRRMTD